MAAVGIQSLTLLLCVVLILSTGAIIGTFTLTTWDDLLDKARQTGDDGFELCLQSGHADIELVSAQYLSSVLKSVDTAVKEYLQRPEQALLAMAKMGQSFHPNVSTNPSFINNQVRHMQTMVYQSVASHGVDMIMYETYPWSPAYQQPYDPSSFIPCGGIVVSRVATGDMVPLPENGSLIYMTYETIDATNGAFGYGTYARYGETDSLGYIKNPAAGCNFLPNYQIGEQTGSCVVPRALIELPDAVALRGTKLLNVVNGGYLQPKETFVYSKMRFEFTRAAWDLSYTFSHPEMYNMYPTQDNRVGSVTAAITADEISVMLRKQILPAGASLYLVESAEDAVGTVIAYNLGRYKQTYIVDVPGVQDNVPMARAFNITNHSLEDATSHVPSIIAEHGRFVFSHDGNYETVAAIANSSFVEWADSNGTLYWTMTTEMRHLTLLWYATLIVPRASVMDKIDASTNAILTKVDADRSSANAQKEDAAVVMAAVTTATVVCFLLVAIVFTRFITSPLHQLAEEMSSIAVMNLEGVDIDRELSRLSEVSHMQKSFKQMVKNLTEYRHYMPQSVLVNDSEDVTTEGSRTQLSTLDVSSSHHSAGPSISISESVCAKTGMLRVEGMKKKRVSMVYLNIVAWHEFCRSKKDSEVLSAHSRVMERIMHTAQRHKGVCDTFSGDRVLVSFNAYTPIASHRVACVVSSYEIEKSIAEAGVVTVSYGCTTGDARVGNMGCTGMKKVTILAQRMSWVVALERWNRVLSTKGLVDGMLAREISAEVQLKCVGAMMFAKVCKKAVACYAVEGLREQVNQEWMYQIDTQKNAPETMWNDAYTAIIGGDYANAQSILQGVPQNATADFQLLIDFVRTQSFTPENVTLH